jgi:uncharacterized membrane protein
MNALSEYILVSILFVAIDSIYLSSVSKYFNKQIKDIQGSDLVLKIFPTFLCYVILSLGVYYFGVVKNLNLIEAFLLGIFVYGVYETTNMAILKKWRWITVFMDTVWGGILFASVIGISKLII